MDEKYKPLHITATYQLSAEPSPLAQPYNLQVQYDPHAGGGELYVQATGLHSLVLGQQSVRLQYRKIGVHGLDATLFGRPSLVNINRYINLSGLNATVFGKPSLKSSQAFLKASGLNAFQSGQSRISFSLQTAQIVSANPFSLYGHAFVTDAVRYVEQKDSPLFTRYGIAWASHSPRYIEPRGIFELFPARHTIGTSRTIFAQGLDTARFGNRIIPESRSIYPLGFAGEFGLTQIENKLQHLRPRGFLTYGSEVGHRFGIGDVWNLRQYIHPSHIDTEFGPFFGEDGKWQIFNRNRYLQAYGFPQTQFGYQRLDNNARLIAPAGIASPLEVELTKTTVTHQIRKFALPSIEAPYISSGHIVHLGARVIATPGNVFSHYGEPGLKNTRRYFNYIGLSIQSLFGQAMISHAVRTLRIQEDYSIHPPVISLPTVFHGQRYIDMRGLDSGRFGNSYVVSKFNKATPRWTHIDRVGEPVIRNVTPEVKMWGIKDDLYGLPYIGHHTRELKPQGLNAHIFGRARIADSTQQINLNGLGLLSEQINRLHEVKNLQTDDYLPRKIQPKGIVTINFGQSHKIYLNGITPESERPMTLFGNTRVTANTIRVEPGYWEILIGKPVIELGNRSIKVAEGLNFMSFGIPRLSPHTIYAVVESPEQARRNHVNPGQLHYVDGWDSSNGRSKEPGVEFGRPSVTHKQRFLQGVGVVLGIFGNTRIKNAQGFISPIGLNTMRFGVLGPMGTQEIRLRNIGKFTLFGHPSIKSVIRPDPYIRPTGMRSTVVGMPSVDYLNRSIRPVGFDAMRVGTKKNDDRPYMWQGLRIGPHVPTNIGGNVHTLFGQGTWISFKVREIRARGEDFSHVNEYDPHNFKQRMYIWNRTQPQLPSAQIIGPQGFDNLTVRVPDIRPAAHYIRPDGNMDNYRKGGI